MPEHDLDTKVKLAVYEITAETGRIPNSSAVSQKIDLDESEVVAAFGRLHAKRLLLPEPDDSSRIRMAGIILRIAFGTLTESRPLCIAMRSAALRMVTPASH